MRRLVQVAICVALVWFGVLEYGGDLSGGAVHSGDAAKAGAFEMAGLDEKQWAGTEDAYRFVLKQGGASPQHLSHDARSNTETAEKERGFQDEVSGSGLGKQLLGENETGGPKAAQRATAANGVEHQAAGGGEKGASPDTAKAGFSESRRAGGKIVYLTFDDGPSKHTPAVLDILKKEGIKATFFVLGEHVERNPDIAKRIVEEGHSIGNHTYNHVYGQLYGSFGAFADQIMKTDEAIYAATGVRTDLVRAPGGTHGNFDQSYFDALGEAGYIVHDWNVDSGDSKRRGVPASEIVSNVKNSKLGDSLNVLLHDSSGHGELVEALPQIIAYYKGLGYAFQAIGGELKPMQFGVATKLKWARPAADRASRDALIAYVGAREGLHALAQQPVQPSLNLHYGSEVFQLDAASYKLENGTIHVPLHRLMEWLGGTYEQDSDNGIIAASLFGIELFWNGISSSDKQSEGMVPIRSTLALFDMEISNYEMGKESRDIWIGE